VASAIVVVGVGGLLAYLGVSLSLLGADALGEGEMFLGLASLVLGLLFVAGPAAVVLSQVRAMLRRRG
jgi:hypothetical protein